MDFLRCQEIRGPGADRPADSIFRGWEAYARMTRVFPVHQQDERACHGFLVDEAKGAGENIKIDTTVTPRTLEQIQFQRSYAVHCTPVSRAGAAAGRYATVSSQR